MEGPQGRNAGDREGGDGRGAGRCRVAAAAADRSRRVPRLPGRPQSVGLPAPGSPLPPVAPRRGRAPPARARARPPPARSRRSARPAAGHDRGGQHASADKVAPDYLSRVPPVYSGIRLRLVAKFNLRYHRTGIALRDTLRAMGCGGAWVEERTRGLDRVLRRSLPRRPQSAPRRQRPELVLVFQGARLPPEVIDQLRQPTRGPWINWFPDRPHQPDLSLRIGRAYDRGFRFDTSMMERHPRSWGPGSRTGPGRSRR